jgi:hypothetical protein
LLLLKNLESTSFCSRRRASWSPRQGPVGRGEHPAGPSEWGFSRRTLSTSRFGCMPCCFPKDRQGRQMRIAQRQQEPRRVSGQISFSWFAARSKELSLPANAAIGPWNKQTMRGGSAIYSVPTDTKPQFILGRPLLQSRYPFQELSRDRAIRHASRLQHGLRFLWSQPGEMRRAVFFLLTRFGSVISEHASSFLPNRI